MSSHSEERDGGIYGRFWDYYVDELSSKLTAGGDWPGDEWGSEAMWQERFDSLFPAAEVASWARAVEIGPGSGKYTIKVLDASMAVVRGYDVSKRFLEVCAERCTEYIRDGRLSLQALHGVDPKELLEDIERQGWKRQIDGFYSIDVMVHIDLQYLIVYWITAAAALRPGGHLVMTLNDVTRDGGFSKLLRDIESYFPVQGRPPLGSGKFEWLSPDIVESILSRLGFEIILSEPAGRDTHVWGCDSHVVAQLANPALADDFVQWISGEPVAVHRGGGS